jgi:hypothetical protein
MEEAAFHPGLELRLEALAERIAGLREDVANAAGIEKIEELGAIDELERRHHELALRLHALDRAGPGIAQDMKAELERMIDDLTGTVADFILRADATYQAAEPSRT